METYLLFGCNELIYLVLRLKLICYLDVMNLFAICHLDVNATNNELIYLVLLKVYYVKDDCFVMLLLIMLNSLKRCYILVCF